MAESSFDVFGMEPDTIDIIRDNLKDRYDSGFPVLKELIQNANDAEASMLRIEKSNGIKNAKHPLLQKPALIVFNNGVVTNTDLKGIRSVGLGGKRGRTDVIGKFGLGMKSIFHFCDMFFYIALQNSNPIIHAVNPYIDSETKEDKQHPSWNIFSSEDKKLLFEESKAYLDGNENGLLLWIPLRDGSYPFQILNDRYDIQDIWKLNSEELKREISISLVSLDISTPCINKKRTLSKVLVNTQIPAINLYYEEGSDFINAENETYCHIKESGLLSDEKGENLLSLIISKDKFTKIQTYDINGNPTEKSPYKKEQNVSLAVIEFPQRRNNSIYINWCSYLPLNGADDFFFNNSKINSEYHILAHANFSIDSGRRNIVKFNSCVDIAEEYQIEDIEEDKDTQKEWNKVLVREYILPKILEFCTNSCDSAFLETLLMELVKNVDTNLGFLCLNKGIPFFTSNKWEYRPLSSIKECGYFLLNKVNNYYGTNRDFKKNLNFISLAVQICNYIQSKNSDMNWAISNADSLTNEDLYNIYIICAKENFPILILPKELKGEYLQNYKIESSEIIINFLLQFENFMEDKVCSIYESLCSNNTISKQISKEIFSDYHIKRYVKLFKTYYLSENKVDFIEEGKTYDEICELSDSSLMFYYSVHHQGASVIEKQLIYKFQRVCSNKRIYVIGEDVARNQLFLTGSDNYIIKFENDETSEKRIKLLDSQSIEAILYSIQQNKSDMFFSQPKFINNLVNEAADMEKSEIEKYSLALRSLLLGHEADETHYIYKLDITAEDEEKAKFICNIIDKYAGIVSEVKDHVIQPGIVILDILYTPLSIKPLKITDLERKLLPLSFNLTEATAEEKDRLATYVYDEEVFKSLSIHKTINNQYVVYKADNTYLESSDSRISFPINYVLPNGLSIIKRNDLIPSQKFIPELTFKIVINKILCDEQNSLGTYDSLKLVNYLISLFENSRISKDDIWPNSRKRKWITDNNHSFYSLDEVIDYPKISKDLISMCSGVTLISDIEEKFFSLRPYFINTKEDSVIQLLHHPNKEGNNVWPWFNIFTFKCFLDSQKLKDLWYVIKLADDCSIKILNYFYADDFDSYISLYKREIPENSYIVDRSFLSKRCLNLVCTISKLFDETSLVDSICFDFICELFDLIDETDILNLIQQIKISREDFKLPSENLKWISIQSLANPEKSFPELPLENTLNSKLKEKFPKINERLGDIGNTTNPSAVELIEILANSRNSKLWGVFCYLISQDSDLNILYNYEEGLLEQNTLKDLVNFRLPKKVDVHITLYQTKNNWCNSITDKEIRLPDAKDINKVFYNSPRFENSILYIDLFNNFSSVTESVISDAIKDLFIAFGCNEPGQDFFGELNNPSQSKLETAVNLIFSHVFDTLKMLKLNTRSGLYNSIANEFERYKEASRTLDVVAMADCWKNVRRSIESNEKNIQIEIRNRVIDFIRDAEYQERCILFELFQNADDAYNQRKNKNTPYFNVNDSENIISIEHLGRPINEYHVGGDPEFKSDLENMLTLGWSDKPVVHETQTGKFGYGFKTVYFISDEPHIRSGNYNFVIKAALYPQDDKEDIGWTPKTIIELNLNDNGKKHHKDIMDEFSDNAKFLTIFAKKIREIKFNDKTYEKWEPESNTTTNFFDVELDRDTIVFRTIPREIENRLIKFVTFAFKRNGEKVYPLEEDVCKVWCLAPLNSFMGLNFAINADFKTNTGRQSLAIENPENKEIITKIAPLFVDSVFDLLNEPEFGKFVPSLINVLLNADTKTDHFMKAFSDLAVKKSLLNRMIPDGVKSLFPYSNQLVYSISAKYFNDKIETQHKMIEEMNSFLEDCSENQNIIITTQILADLLISENNSIKITRLDSVIRVLDNLLYKHCDNIQEQISIVKKFKNRHLLYSFAIKEKEELESCYLFDAYEHKKIVTEITEVSSSYGDIKPVLEELFNPKRKNSEEYYKSKAIDSFKSEMEQEDYSQYQLNDGEQSKINLSLEDVYIQWKNDYDKNVWEDKVKKYRASIVPDMFDFNKLKEELEWNDENADKYQNGVIPKQLCALILLSMLQSSTYYGHSKISRKTKINSLWSYLEDFSNGKNLQDLYDDFLNKKEFDEDELSEFETLLRIYKIRKNYEDFRDILRTAPVSGKTTTRELLIPPNGSGMTVFCNTKSLKLGISLLIRELLENGFYNDYETSNELNKFTYLPNSFLKRIVYGTDEIEVTSEMIYEEIKMRLAGEDYLDEFLNAHDYPFWIYGEKK